MQNFYLFDNSKLNGTFPNSIGELVSIENLIIANTSITGTIPTAFCNWTKILSFGLSFNQHNGPIPDCLGNLSTLNSFYINNNHITGTIPAALSYSLVSFIEINASANALVGTIPESLCSITSMNFFDISFNQITGTVPTCITTSWLALKYLIINSNSLHGTIPTNIGIFSGLQLLQLYSNSFSGTIPMDISTLNLLQNFLVQNNQFTGSIDILFAGPIPSIGDKNQLLSLNELHAITNCFTGSIPESICNVTTLTTLYMDGLTSGKACSSRLLPFTFITNKDSYSADQVVTGSIPSCLYSMPGLTSLHLAGNGIQSTLPNEAFNNSKLVNLVLSFNRLSGISIVNSMVH